MQTMISVEHLSKVYRLGQIGTGTFTNDLKAWWAKARGNPNPFTKIGAQDHGNRFGEEIWALRDVNFAVGKGEALGIIGRNGAGKSTLLKILARITAPTSGKVLMKGRLASLLEVGTGFHPELTGRENIYLNGSILGMNKRETSHRFDEIVDFSGVEKFIDTPVKRYSSGMYVRLAFAVAAHLDPEILLVDEVLAVGDAEFQRKCLGKMGEVSQDGRTVLFVSHNMAAIQNLCRNSLLVDKGSVKRLGSSEDVINEYLLQSSGTISGDLQGDQLERDGNGLVRFKEWSAMDEKLGAGLQVRSRQPFELRIGYHSSLVSRNNSVSIAVVFKDLYGQPIFTGATHFTNTVFTDIPPDGIFTCCFEDMPLIPGIYIVHLWCAVNDVVSDYLRDAGRLTVVPTDLFNTGRYPERKHGILAVDHTWRLEE